MPCADTASSLVTEGGFTRALRALLVREALAVCDEDTSVEFHSSRLALAQRVIKNPDAYAGYFALPVAWDEAVQVADSESEAAAIAAATSAVWNSLARAGV